MEDKDETKFKCSTFNGDTADGRTLWPDWLRDVELVLDEWSWAVMNDTVITHDQYEKLSSKKKVKEDEEKLIQTLFDKACKSRNATKGKKTVKDWRTEMQADRETFLTFMRDTEKYILLLLQRKTEGEAKKVVLGVQIESAQQEF